jgi:hypothetical protein
LFEKLSHLIGLENAIELDLKERNSSISLKLLTILESLPCATVYALYLQT